ncbi:MAG TPA: cyclic nucleotide-binding domain-containing protein [Bryobacteraceae bacterium]|nr:cyclic nucleotide-binding domain-containing protein [Bryobacteraceae bacterium]
MAISTTSGKDGGIAPKQPGQNTLSEILRNHAFTRGLNDAQVDALASVASKVAFEEGEIVLADREHSRAFFLVLSGSVSVELCGPNFSVSVQAVGPGQAFGWSALLSDHDTLFRVRAREFTTAARLEGEDLKAACSADPLLGKEVLQRALAVVAGRVRATEIRFAEMCGVRVHS